LGRRGGGFEGTTVLERLRLRELGFARRRAAAAGFGGSGGSWRLLIKGRPRGLGMHTERRGEAAWPGWIELESGSVGGGDDPNMWSPYVSGREVEKRAGLVGSEGWAGIGERLGRLCWAAREKRKGEERREREREKELGWAKKEKEGGVGKKED
jgi:hypothetical protein